jgi:hypothetical protein
VSLFEGQPTGSLAERLKDWTEWDLAMWHVAVVLGLWDDDGNPPGPGHKEGEYTDAWKGHKGTIWSTNPTSEAITRLMLLLVEHGFLEYDNDTTSYRWARK